MKDLSEIAKMKAAENGWTHYLRSRKGGYLALPASSLEEAEAMLVDGSVDADEDCEIVPVN